MTEYDQQSQRLLRLAAIMMLPVLYTFVVVAFVMAGPVRLPREVVSLLGVLGLALFVAVSLLFRAGIRHDAALTEDEREKWSLTVVSGGPVGQFRYLLHRYEGRGSGSGADEDDGDDHKKSDDVFQ